MSKSKIMQGILEAPAQLKGSKIIFNEFINWGEYNDCSASFLWWLNNFSWMNVNLLNDLKDVDAINFSKKIFQNWVCTNPIDSPASKRAWDGHAAAIRVEVIRKLYDFCRDEEWFLDTIYDHGHFLVDAKNYQGPWNHGLDQSLALLDLSFLIVNDEWRNTALKRISETLETIVDSEGVTVEQSVQYQHYNYVQLNAAQKKLLDYKVDFNFSVFEKINLMPIFLAHATKPDGFYECLGDTVKKKAHVIVGTEAEYAATQGKSGRIPRDRFVIYKAGYIFGRSGWGIDRPFSKETFYSIRFGPGRVFHGHNDHMSLTYQTRGVNVLNDSSFDGYTNDNWRNYFRSSRAHNQVVLESKRKHSANFVTKLVDKKIFDLFQDYLFEDSPYLNVNRKRRVIFCTYPEVILVFDIVESEEELEYSQIWNLNPDLTPIIYDKNIIIGGAGFNIEMHQLWPVDSMKIDVGESDPIQGWLGLGINSRVPCTSLISKKKGKKIGFLTAFTFSNSNDKISVFNKKIKAGGFIRKIIFDDSVKYKLTVNMRCDGSFDLEHFAY